MKTLCFHIFKCNFRNVTTAFLVFLSMKSSWSNVKENIFIYSIIFVLKYFHLFLHLLLFMLFTQKAKISLRRWYLLERKERPIWQSRKQGVLPGEQQVRSPVADYSSVCEGHKKWRRTKQPMMKVKEESEKVGLKLKFRKLRSWHPVPSLHGK